MHDPREPHFAALKRVLSYVRGRLDFGLQLYASSTSSLVAYCDVVDWAGCPSTWRSTFGYYDDNGGDDDARWWWWVAMVDVVKVKSTMGELGGGIGEFGGRLVVEVVLGSGGGRQGWWW
nr:ribonuclease H-like domain-containing protein [Tanacetum cinerariifolium]